MTVSVQTLRSSVVGKQPTAGSQLPGQLWVNFPDLQLGVINASQNPQSLLAVRLFSSLTTYNVGDFVIYSGNIYFCNVQITSPATFNSSQWTSYLPLTGGTLTGPLTISPPSGQTTLFTLNKPDGAEASSSNNLIGQVQGNKRWQITLGDNTVESGSNTGSNFDISSYNDIGVLINTPIQIVRSSGLIYLGGQSVYIAPAAGLPALLVLNKPAAGLTNWFYGQTNNLNRWAIELGDGAPESGANAGSNFALVRYNDAGSSIGMPISITRSNGLTSFGGQAVYIAPTAGLPALLILNKPAAGLANGLYGETAGSNRWSITLGDGTVESGSNAGSDFQVQSFNDTGTLLFNPLSILRASGQVRFNIPSGAGYSNRPHIDAPAGTGKAIMGSTAGVDRWALVLGTTTAESGSNVGSDFALQSFTDAGALLSTPLTIIRSNGSAVFSGQICAQPTAGQPAQMLLNKPASGQGNIISGATAGLNRWVIEVGDTALESGSNAGSNFSIYNYNDAGTYVSTPFSIVRSNGQAIFGSTTVINGGSLSLNAPATTANPIIIISDGNARAVARLYTLGVAGVAYLDNPVAGTNIYLDPSGNFGYSSGTGVAYKAGGGSWTATSDARIKTVIDEYQPGLDEVLQLRPVVYRYNGNDTATEDFNQSRMSEDEPTVESHSGPAPYPASPHYTAAKDGKSFVGLVAQEMETIFPDMVSKREGYVDGQKITDLRDVDVSNLIFALVNSVKTLSKRLEALEAK